LTNLSNIGGFLVYIIKQKPSKRLNKVEGKIEVKVHCRSNSKSHLYSGRSYKVRSSAIGMMIIITFKSLTVWHLLLQIQKKNTHTSDSLPWLPPERDETLNLAEKISVCYEENYQIIDQAITSTGRRGKYKEFSVH
jgi:hypothetical protein